LKSDYIKQEFLSFFKLKPSPRSWHIPFLAGLAVGIPLMFGYFLVMSNPLSQQVWQAWSSFIFPATAILSRR